MTRWLALTAIRFGATFAGRPTSCPARREAVGLRRIGVGSSPAAYDQEMIRAEARSGPYPG